MRKCRQAAVGSSERPLAGQIENGVRGARDGDAGLARRCGGKNFPGLRLEDGKSKQTWEQKT